MNFRSFFYSKGCYMTCHMCCMGCVEATHLFGIEDFFVVELCHMGRIDVVVWCVGCNFDVGGFIVMFVVFVVVPISHMPCLDRGPPSFHFSLTGSLFFCLILCAPISEPKLVTCLKVIKLILTESPTQNFTKFLAFADFSLQVSVPC